MRSAFAPSGESRSALKTRSGSGASRSALLSHATTPKVARVNIDPNSIPLRVRRGYLCESVRMYEISEADVQSERENGRNTERLELLARGVARRTRETIDLRIDAAIVGPQVQVARGEVERSRTRTEVATSPALGQRQRRRELAPADERCWLEEAVERCRRIVTRRDDHRLLLERRARHELAVHDVSAHEAEAVLTAHATDALRVVVPLVATLVVEQRRHPESAAKEVNPWLQRREIARRRVATVDLFRADEHFVLRRIGAVDEDAVAVLVLPPENWLSPEAEERITGARLPGRVDLWRDLAEAHELVLVHRGAD